MVKIEIPMPLYEARLSLTGRCNYKCVYCGPFSDGKASMGYKELSLIQVKKLAPFLKEKALNVQLTGGEPTLRKDLTKIVQILANSGIKGLGLTTNGSMIDKNYAQKLLDSGLSDTHIHIPSLNQEVFEKITKEKKKGVVDQIKEVAIFLREKGSRVEFNTPVNYFNLQTIPALEDFCYEHKINLKLIEEINLTGDQIGEEQIKNLFKTWFKKRSLNPEEIAREKQYGQIYELGGFSFRVASATKGLADFLNGKGDTILYDGRYWIGGREEKFVFTPSYFLRPKIGNFHDLRKNLNKTIRMYYNEKK